MNGKEWNGIERNMTRAKRSFFLLIGMMLVSVLILGACQENEGSSSTNGNNGNVNDGNVNSNTSNEKESEEGLTISTSFSVLNDIVENVIGDRGSTEYIVPIGEEPHEYEPTPSDFQKVDDAHVFMTNGLDLEEWLGTLVENVSDTPIVEVSEGVTPIPLVGDDESDPHAWLDPVHVKQYVENIVDYLTEADPDGAEHYEQQAEAYMAELDELHEWILDETMAIPEEHRLIVISENAFKYFGERYGFDTDGIWEINSHEEGTPRQIERLAKKLEERAIPSVFVETTLDHRYMESVAADIEAEISGEVYTDAIGPEDSDANSYLGMMRHNVQVFVDGLAP